MIVVLLTRVAWAASVRGYATGSSTVRAQLHLNPMESYGPFLNASPSILSRTATWLTGAGFACAVAALSVPRRLVPPWTCEPPTSPQ